MALNYLKNKDRLPVTPNKNIINNRIVSSNYGDYKYELKQNDIPSGAPKYGFAMFFQNKSQDPLNVIIQMYDNVTQKFTFSVETNYIPFKDGLFDFKSIAGEKMASKDLPFTNLENYTYFCFFKTSIENPITYDIYFTQMNHPTWDSIQCDKIKVVWKDVPSDVKGDSTTNNTKLGNVINLVLDGQFNSTKLNLFDTTSLDDINNQYSWSINQIRNLKTYLTPNVVYTCEYNGVTQANKVLVDRIYTENFDLYDDEYKVIASSPRKFLRVYSPIGDTQYQLDKKYIAINLNGLFALRPRKTVTLTFYLKKINQSTTTNLPITFEFAELGRMNNKAAWDIINIGNFEEQNTLNINDFPVWAKATVQLTRPTIDNGDYSDYDQSITQIRILLPNNLNEYEFGITNLMVSYGENDFDFIRTEGDVVRGLLDNPEILNMVNYGINAKSSTLGQVSCNAFDNIDKETSILADGRLIQRNDVYAFYHYDDLSYIDEDKPINYIPYQPLFDLLVNRYEACDGNSDDFVTAYSLYDKNIYPSYITDDDITTMDVSLLIAKNKTEFSKDWFQASNASKGISIVELSRGCNLPTGQGLDIKVYGIQGKMDTFIYQANMDNYEKAFKALPNVDTYVISSSDESDYGFVGAVGDEKNDVGCSIRSTNYPNSYTGDCFYSKTNFTLINSDYLTDFRFDKISTHYGKINTTKIKQFDCNALTYSNTKFSRGQKISMYNLISLDNGNNYNGGKTGFISIAANAIKQNQISILPKKNTELPDANNYSLILNTSTEILKNTVLDNIASSFNWNYTRDEYNPISDTNSTAKKVLMPFAVSQVALFGIKFTGGITPTNYKGAWFSFQTSRKKIIKVKQIQGNLTKLQSQILNANNFAVWLDTTGGDSKPSDLPSNYIPLRVDISTIKKVGDIENLIMDAINYYEIKILDYRDSIMIGKNNDIEIFTKLFSNTGYKGKKNIVKSNNLVANGEPASAGLTAPPLTNDNALANNSNFYNTANVNWYLSLI